MKIQNSKSISAFGGINFVFDYLDKLGLSSHYNSLPQFKNQSKYSWSDIFNSLQAIYYCGGDSIEDLNTHLKGHFVNNPFVKIPSPDTVLRRLKELTESNQSCRTKRGVVEHVFNTNKKLENLNISILKSLGVFKEKQLTLDYDNTIIFNEKYDSKMTYKKNPGYQPGVCTVNENYVLYIENRNGNSDAKSFQDDTLRRLFNLLEENSIKKINHFRADAASYQYDVIKLLDKKVDNFYIGCRNSYIEKYFGLVHKWEEVSTSSKNIIEVGEVNIKPFYKQSKRDKKQAKEYRLIIKRTKNKDGQINAFTNDAYDYRGIITNNYDLSPTEIATFYNHRGNMEKQFDILKNDFGWNNMPFSKLEQNTVFLYFTALFRNLYNSIINHFSKISNTIKSNFRMKKFIFRFIIIPAKWVKRSRQLHLRLYGKHSFAT